MGKGRRIRLPLPLLCLSQSFVYPEAYVPKSGQAVSSLNHVSLSRDLSLDLREGAVLILVLQSGRVGQSKATNRALLMENY